MVSTTSNTVGRIAQALNPESVKIDGRDNRDRLAFVAAYARLIQYYNQRNQLAGNWQDFFIKDPAILLAATSKTDYEDYHLRYAQIDHALQQSQQLEKQCVYINQLCLLLREMFSTINQWVRSMEHGASWHSLHLYLQKKIRETLSGQLSLMIALQQCLTQATHGAVGEADVVFYRSFQPIWFESSIRPELPLSGSDARIIIKPWLNALRRIYHIVFDVVMHSVEYAGQVFYEHKSEQTPYPDTALLMTFSRLMESQQNEINQLAGKHLDFYYDRILCQNLQPAQADHAFVCLKLADKVGAFNLPAGSLFKAGTYPDQSEILFCNEVDAEFNQAAVSSVQTLYYGPANTGSASISDPQLYLGKVAAPTKVKRNQQQEIISWDGFGNSQGASVQQGFAFASPILFLQGGLRKITISLYLEADSQHAGEHLEFLTSFQDSQYYLSTSQGWFSVTPEPSCSLKGDSVQLAITLTPEDPAIAAFAKCPDGYDSSWPMFKMMLGTSVDLSTPPILKQLTIEVDVDEFGQFSMANDISMLPNTGARSIWGAVPEVGSRFYVGSNECFAKPLSSLSLTLNWDSLPSNFSTYYAEYNQYLSSQYFSINAFQGQWSLLSRSNWGKSNSDSALFTALTPTTFEAPTGTPSSTGGSILSGSTNYARIVAVAANGACVALSAESAEAITKKNNSSITWTWNAYPGADSYQVWLGTAKGKESYCFSSSTNQFVQKAEAWSGTPGSIECIAQSTTFAVIPAELHPCSLADLALAPLPPVAKASDGYLCLELATPEYAFGNSLYAKVVSWVSLNNAETLISKAKGEAVFAKAAKAVAAGLSNAGKLAMDAVSGLWRFGKKIFAGIKNSIAQILGHLFKSGSSGAEAQSKATSPSTESTEAEVVVVAMPNVLLSMPNLPYVPKISGLTASYKASSSTVISGSPPSGQGVGAAYPLEIYHYGSFKPYLAYDAASPGKGLGFVNLTPQAIAGNQEPALPLFTGVGGQGCLYVALSGVQAPCTLSLYAEICADENHAAPDEENVGYYYWSNVGWWPLTVLRDDTDNLNCPGIIKFEIPAEIPAELAATPIIEQTWQKQLPPPPCSSSPIMPGNDFWLAIAGKGRAADGGVNFKVSYLNTQAVKLTRVSIAGLPSGETPQLVAKAISATKNKTPQIAAIDQPFASFGGIPAENKSSYGGANSFYRRVSKRLNNKDRCVTKADFVEMAHAACTSLYYAKALDVGPGELHIGLVNGYANAQLPNAFRPVVGGMDQIKIIDFITSRASAQTRLHVSNLKPQQLTITAEIIVEPGSNNEAMELALNQMLRLYLSPWICSDQPQVNIAQSTGQGIEHSQLINFLESRKGVVSVSTLQMQGDELQDDGTILVSADRHKISLSSAGYGRA